MIDGVLEHSPAEHVRRPAVPPESPTLGFTHLQFEAMLGLLGLRIFEASGANIADLGEEHGHRVLRVCGKGSKVVLVPLPPAVARAIERAVDGRSAGPILLNSRGAQMDRHAATRRLRNLAAAAGVRIGRTHPHMLRHTFVTTMQMSGVGRVAQGISALGSHGTVRNSLPLHGSYHPGYTGNTVQAQWAKNRGYCLVILCHAALALRYLLSRLYFWRIQRIR